jgi:hypothetical protein
LPPDHPSLSKDPPMKLSRQSYGNPKENRKENSKTKWARVRRDGCHPLSTWFIWRQPKDETTPIT